MAVKVQCQRISVLYHITENKYVIHINQQIYPLTVAVSEEEASSIHSLLIETHVLQDHYVTTSRSYHALQACFSPYSALQVSG